MERNYEEYAVQMVQILGHPKGYEAQLLLIPGPHKMCHSTTVFLKFSHLNDRKEST